MSRAKTERDASVCPEREFSCRLMERWYLYAIALTAAAICMNLAVLPKTIALVEGIFLRSLWFPVEEGQMGAVRDAARRGLLIYSLATGIRMGVLILFVAVSARALLFVWGRETSLRPCGTAAVIFVSVLFAKDLLGALCLALAPVENTTVDGLRFSAGLSLLLDTARWPPAASYLAERVDLFGLGSVALSSAWLRGKLNIEWMRALGVMLPPALAALLAGAVIHIALSAKLGRIGAGSF